MKIKTDKARIICSNNNGLHNYFAWPSVAKLQDNRLAMVASGFRLGHICPFGKGVMCVSEDEGETWSNPQVIIDTPLDDRDCGICAFGDNNVIVTSFNNSLEQQRKWADTYKKYKEYKLAYIDAVKEKDSECEKRYIGSTFVMSSDGGKTFGDIQRIPVTTPHGPCKLPDGNLLYVGRIFSGDDSYDPSRNHIQCYLLRKDGTNEKISEIENISDDIVSCEPYAIMLKSGKIIVHIRAGEIPGEDDYFGIYQCESNDGGKSFSKPRKILESLNGSAPHLLEHSNGTLISVYGRRDRPYGIVAMFSKDEGKTWDMENMICENDVNFDLGYPCSVELDNGKILTVFYAHPEKNTSAVIMQNIWDFE